MSSVSQSPRRAMKRAPLANPNPGKVWYPVVGVKYDWTEQVAHDYDWTDPIKLDLSYMVVKYKLEAYTMDWDGHGLRERGGGRGASPK